ncbi:MAG: hypothetical protein HYR57_03935 [Candidatus Koribacter versatilis]|nr:hypothetical protein [Candidatus Koribacter versatilis]
MRRSIWVFDVPRVARVLKVIQDFGRVHSPIVNSGTEEFPPQIYCTSDELLNTPAPALIQGLRALPPALHADVSGPAHGLRSITEVLPGKGAPGQ